MVDLADRYSRQTTLVPRSALRDLEVTVIGVGAIGRQVALQLASLGAPSLRLIDCDRVELANVTSQGYWLSDLGLAKVTATGRAVRRIDASIRLDLIEDRYRPAMTAGDAVFCCVDSITARQTIWRSVGQRCRFWCDGRMLGEVMRILAVTNSDERAYYPTTLFEESDAVAGACTARGVIYTAAISAGLMVHQFCRWLRGQPTERDLALNLLAGELILSS